MNSLNYLFLLYAVSAGISFVLGMTVRMPVWYERRTSLKTGTSSSSVLRDTTGKLLSVARVCGNIGFAILALGTGADNIRNYLGTVAEALPHDGMGRDIWEVAQGNVTLANELVDAGVLIERKPLMILTWACYGLHEVFGSWNAFPLLYLMVVSSLISWALAERCCEEEEEEEEEKEEGSRGYNAVPVSRTTLSSMAPLLRRISSSYSFSPSSSLSSSSSSNDVPPYIEEEDSQGAEEEDQQHEECLRDILLVDAERANQTRKRAIIGGLSIGLVVSVAGSVIFANAVHSGWHLTYNSALDAWFYAPVLNSPLGLLGVFYYLIVSILVGINVMRTLKNRWFLGLQMVVLFGQGVAGPSGKYFNLVSNLFEQVALWSIILLVLTTHRDFVRDLTLGNKGEENTDERQALVVKK